MDISGNSVDVSGSIVDVSGGVIVDITTIISIDQLVHSHDILVKKEADDRALLSKISNPDPSDLTAKLYQWARVGFPPIYPLIPIILTVPTTCADGATRTFYDYVEYLLGGTLADEMAKLQTRLPGMQLSYSFGNTMTTIHVSKLG